MAVALNNLASFHLIQGNLKKVESLFRRVLAIREKALTNYCRALLNSSEFQYVD